MVITYHIRLMADECELLSRLRPAVRFTNQTLSEDLGWSKSKTSKVIANLYGLIHIVERPFYDRELHKELTQYIALYLSHEHHGRVQDAIEHEGLFEGELLESDLPVLSYIFDTDSQLRSIYGDGWNPRFTERDVARVLQKSRYSVRRSMDRLVGILASTRLQQLIDIGPNFDDSRFIYIYAPRWFLPSSRRMLAEDLIIT